MKKYLITLKNEKGMSLLTVLIFVSVLVTLGVALLAMTNSDIKLSALQRDSTIAFYKAESGIEKALWWLNDEEINSDGKTFDGVLPSPYSPQDVTVQITQNSPNSGQIKIISTGIETTSGGKVTGKRTIEVIAEEVSGNQISYDYSLLAENFIGLENSADIGGDVHCNGSIKIEDEVNISGNLSASGTIIDQGTGTIGSIEENAEEVPFPEFNYAEFLDGEYIHYKPSEGIGDYGDGILNEGDTVTIEFLGEESEGLYWDGGEEGQVYYIEGNFKIQAYGKLNLENAIIIVSGNVTLENDAILDHIRTGDYQNPVAIATEYGNIILENNSHINNGVLRSDNGETKFENNVKLDGGAVVANTIKFENEGALINQSGDPDLSYTEGSGVVDKVTWREVYN